MGAQRSETPDFPQELPLIPLRDLVLFPNLVVPLFVGRERSIRALEEAMRQGHLVALATQKVAETQDPEPDDIYEIGSIAAVMQELKLPDGTAKALVEGQVRMRIVEVVQVERWARPAGGVEGQASGRGHLGHPAAIERHPPQHHHAPRQLDRAPQRARPEHAVGHGGVE